MTRIFIFFLLFTLYCAYSLLVYTEGTQSRLSFSKEDQLKINRGKEIFQSYNCTSCHQLYGLGGYLGPDLTTAFSDSSRGGNYIKAMIRSGGGRMPRFPLSGEDIEALTTYLRYTDATTRTNKYLNKD